jgi:hypothetical protein
VSSLLAILQKHPFATWMCSVLVLGLIGTVVIFALYNEFLDCSIPETHESANRSERRRVVKFAEVVRRCL